MVRVLSKIKYLVVFCLVLVSGMATSASAQTGKAISLTEIITLTKSLGGFLYILGSVLGGVTIIVSGIMYFFAGSNPQGVQRAKDILKAGIIGSLIIFGSGIIVATIRELSSDPQGFFM